MQFTLVQHPATAPARPAFQVWASVDHVAKLSDTATTNIWFGIGAPASRFAIPKLSEPWRADGLWETTCFEAFLQVEGQPGYREWNFAPAGNWQAYDFTGYRQGRDRADAGAPPYIRMEDNFTWWTVGATIAVEARYEWKLGLSVILEEKDGRKSCWALAHPDSERPDFHLPDCFVGRLA
jgi:hypothetical protein